jgi:hypothetical protein
MLCLAVYPPSRATPNSTDFVGQAFGSVDRTTPADSSLPWDFMLIWETSKWCSIFSMLAPILVESLVDMEAGSSKLADGATKMSLISYWNEVLTRIFTEMRIEYNMDIRLLPQLL